MVRIANLDVWRGALLGTALLGVACGGSGSSSDANATDSGSHTDAATGGATTAGSGGAGTAGRAAGTGGLPGAGGGVSTGPCGGATCGPGQSCCGPPECGRCVPSASGVYCPDYCDHCGATYRHYPRGPSCPSERPVLWEATTAELAPFAVPACQDAGTGVPRYCCSAEFVPVCP